MIDNKIDKFTIYGHQACGFCRQAQTVLRANSIQFDYIDIHTENINPDDLAQRIGKPANTVPQIFYDNSYIGGYQELMKYLRDKNMINKFSIIRYPKMAATLQLKAKWQAAP